ncbi:MAG: penicillin-binding protein 1B [Gammaproteobacteria bacterium]
MAKKKSVKANKRRFRQGPGRFLSLVVLSQIGLILLLTAAAYVLWLDYRITREFEGKRWSLPARVYSRPHEIFVDQSDGIGGLESELRALNYRASASPDNPGEYRRGNGSVEIMLRPFRYWDGSEPAKHLRVDFSGEGIRRILDLSGGQNLSYVRLEPRLIGKIYPAHNEDRVLVPFGEVPPFLIEALIAVEDRYYYEHAGIDIRGIARAVLANLLSGEITQGGSTLTQQLVKNFFLTPERTFRRKINEMIMAMLLERRYSKREILSAYINEVYLGQQGARGIHGFGTAAEFYFGKPLGELEKHELALLAGLVRGASYYNPRRHPERALTRRNLVLNLMAGQGYLEQREADRLKSKPVETVRKPAWSGSRYPAFLQLVRRELLRNYRMEDLRNEGLRIFTTLEPPRQDRIERAVRRRLSQLEQSRTLEENALETAVLVLNISNGEILALMGGRREEMTAFNRALDSKRPIGSLIKPFIYQTALSAPGDYHVLTGLDDTGLRIREPDGDIWEPKNYSHQEHGKVTLMEALTRSYNLATVRLGMQLGVESVIATLRRAGADMEIKPYPSLLLGAVELSPLQVAGVYQTLANGGYGVPLKTIREVLDKFGNPLQRSELELKLSLDPGASFLTGYLLSQVVEYGTARQLRAEFPESIHLAGKTGTTNDSRDSWFVGYDDRVLAVTWLGRDDFRPTPFTGSSGAMRLWADIMKEIPLHSLNLPESDLIEWEKEIKFRYGDDCLKPEAIPYIKGYPPDNEFPCNGGTDSEKTKFNPLRWFQ